MNERAGQSSGWCTATERLAMVVDAFLDALARRDYIGVTWLRTWFGAADQVEVIGSGHQTFAVRHRFWYRFALDREGRATVIDQEGCCDVADGRVHDIALVCSGFQPAVASRATALNG